MVNIDPKKRNWPSFRTSRIYLINEKHKLLIRKACTFNEKEASEHLNIHFNSFFAIDFYDKFLQNTFYWLYYLKKTHFCGHFMEIHIFIWRFFLQKFTVHDKLNETDFISKSFSVNLVKFGEHTKWESNSTTNKTEYKYFDTVYLSRAVQKFYTYTIGGGGVLNVQ